MRYFCRALQIAIVVSFASLPWQAAAGDIDVILQQRSAEWCSPGSGTFDAGSVIRRDLTGDGEKDLIVDHRGLRCDDPLVDGCGIRACLVQIYVRKKGKLVLEVHDLSVGVLVGKGKRPSLTFISHEGIYSTVRWQGGRFRTQ